MKVLLFLNGFEGCQTGIEDGFKHILNLGKITELKWFYFEDFANKNSLLESRNSMLQIASELQPNLIVFFHTGSFPFNYEFISQLKNLKSTPVLVYDEGDMYGTWAKPISRQMKIILRNVDIVSIRGLGRFYNQIRRLNKNIIYTPNHNDLARFDNQSHNDAKRNFDLVLMANAVRPKFFSFIRRMPGAKEREKFIKILGKFFPKKLKIYGNGWDGFIGKQGPIDFYQQNEIFKRNWITVSFEHYPKIPFFFSNRIPIALSNGSLVVCNHHEGYEKLFPNNDFIYFFKDNSEAIDIINFLLSLKEEDLRIKSLNARKFALKHFHPNVIWNNFFDTILNYDLNKYT